MTQIRPDDGIASKADADATLRDVANAHQPFRTESLALSGCRASRCRELRSGSSLITRISAGRSSRNGSPTRRSCSGLSVTLGLTVVAMAIGIGHRARPRDRPHVERPARQLAGGPVHLVLPRHAAAGAADLLVQSFDTVPGDLDRDSVRPDACQLEHQRLITPMTAAIAGLALNEAAYMAEIIRGGLLSVDHGQIETTEAFGMTRAGRCGGSSFRRRCARSSRRPATS